MRLRTIRTEKKITQDYIAKKMGVNQNTVSQWESGTRRPDIDTLIRLAKVLGCTPNDILGFGEGRTPEKNEEEKTPVAG